MCSAANRRTPGQRQRTPATHLNGFKAVKIRNACRELATLRAFTTSTPTPSWRVGRERGWVFHTDEGAAQYASEDKAEATLTIARVLAPRGVAERRDARAPLLGPVVTAPRRYAPCRALDALPQGPS